MADKLRTGGCQTWFYDIEDKYSLKRWSLGGDLRWNAFDLYAQQILRLSDWTNTICARRKNH